jgi:hypothetical protein
MGAFDNFSGIDAAGNQFNFSNVAGKVILVTFWPPQSKAARRELMILAGLGDDHKRQGLTGIGISMNANSARTLGALDDTGMDWPQIPDRMGLARKYNVDPNAVTTLVLDSSHRIVASGLRGAELEKKVVELLAAQ